uniref:Uncharacterized protein n=1 Tax=Panagrolaimus sp. JU765 TaxID=591449 RepID=A0AC34QC42_9BILA
MIHEVAPQRRAEIRSLFSSILHLCKIREPGDETANEVVNNYFGMVSDLLNQSGIHQETIDQAKTSLEIIRTASINILVDVE